MAVRWNPSLISGPLSIPIYGEPVEIETEDGPVTHRPITGYVPGYHLNVAERLMTAGLEAYRVNPVTPFASHAGTVTACLVFADEAEALASDLASQATEV